MSKFKYFILLLSVGYKDKIDYITCRRVKAINKTDAIDKYNIAMEISYLYGYYLKELDSNGNLMKHKIIGCDLEKTIPKTNRRDIMYGYNR